MAIKLFNIEDCSSLPLKAGVYRITCSESDKNYIGISNNIRFRINTHRKELNHDQHSNPHLQKAFNKYGENAFEIEVLELMDCDDDSALLKAESKWMSIYNSLDGAFGYNIVPTDIEGKIRHTEDHKQYMSKIMSGRPKSKETAQKISEALIGHKGTPHTDEFKDKVRARMTNRYVSAETRSRMSEAKRGKPPYNKGKPGKPYTDEQKLECSKRTSGSNNPRAAKVELSDGTIVNSIDEACRELGVTRGQIFTLFKKGIVRRVGK